VYSKTTIRKISFLRSYSRYSKNRKNFFYFKLYLKILRIRFDEFYGGEKFLNAYSG